MKKSQLGILKLLVITAMITFASCSKEEIHEEAFDSELEQLELRTEETDAHIIEAATARMEASIENDSERLKTLGIPLDESNTRATVQTSVRRYYNSSSTVHTYFSPETGRGHRSGNYEGVAFRTLGVTANSASPNGTRLAILFLHPQGIDFVISTSAGEDNALSSRGWRTAGPSGNFVFLYRDGGNGRKRLYRFYKASVSDHLFTTNYSEGINNGYSLEGVSGWVY